MDLEIKDNTQNLGLQIKECVQSPEISIPEIFQMNKQIINDKIYLNLRTSNYILSFPYASNILDSPNETIFSKENFKENIFVSKNYDSELMDMKLSNFFSEQNYILTSKNSIYLLENNRNSLLLDQSTIKQLYFLESSYHPKILYLMSSEQICLFDYRTSKPNILIENQKKERNKFFGIKHYFDQFLLCSTSKHFSFFDIRFPKSPILEFRHFSEENPPSILEFSSFLSDIQPNSTSIQSDIKNIEIIERYNLMDDNQKRVLTAFSADKTGSAIANLIDSNMLKEENWKELIKVIEISQEPSFSFQKYLKGLTPLLLYSLNMRDEKYRISGISCVSLKKRKVNLLFQNDNYGGINLQILSNNTESEDKLRHLTMKFEEKQEFEDYIDLDQLRYDRLFKKTEIKKDKIYLDFSNEFELESDNELEDSNTLNDKNKKFLNFDKIFKKVLRNSLKLKTQNHDNTFRNHAKKIHLNETAEVQQSLESTQMNLEDLIFNQTTDELMKQKTNRENCYNEKSLITKELEEYLKAKWDET